MRIEFLIRDSKGISKFISFLKILKMLSPFDDEYFMKKALEEAELAYEKGEIPVGVVVVINDKIIARGHNLTETLNDVTAHAEMQAITAAANFLGGKYLKKCTMYITLEPCQMCAGALYWSQISKIVFAAEDLQRGYRKMGVQLHPKTEVKSGILELEAATLLKRSGLKIISNFLWMISRFINSLQNNLTLSIFHLEKISIS